MAGASDQRFTRVRFVERELANGRRYVQSVGATTPTLLSGSAPMIWDLLDDYPTLESLVGALQQRFSDSPEVIEGGVRTALDSLVEAALVEVD